MFRLHGRPEDDTIILRYVVYLFEVRGRSGAGNTGAVFFLSHYKFGNLPSNLSDVHPAFEFKSGHESVGEGQRQLRIRNELGEARRLDGKELNL